MIGKGVAIIPCVFAYNICTTEKHPVQLAVHEGVAPYPAIPGKDWVRRSSVQGCKTWPRTDKILHRAGGGRKQT